MLAVAGGYFRSSFPCRRTGAGRKGSYDSGEPRSGRGNGARQTIARRDDQGGAYWELPEQPRTAVKSGVGLPGRKPSADIIGERTDDARSQPATDQDKHDDRIQTVEQLLVDEMNFLKGLNHGMHTHRLNIAWHSTV